MKKLIYFIIIMMIIVACNSNNKGEMNDKKYEKFTEYNFEEKGFSIKLPDDYIVKKGLTKNIMISNSKDEKRFLAIQRRMTPTKQGLSAKEYYLQVVDKIKIHDLFKGEVLSEEEIEIDETRAIQGKIKFLGNKAFSGDYAIQLKTILRTKKSIVDITLVAQEDEFDNYLKEFKLITNSFKENN